MLGTGQGSGLVRSVRCWSGVSLAAGGIQGDDRAWARVRWGRAGMS